MHAIVVSVAAAIILSSVTPADARPRMRLKSSSASPAATPAPVPRAPTAASQGSGSVLPGALIGGAIGASRPARARSEGADTPTGSTTPAPDRGALMPVSPATASAAPQPVRKPRPACAPGASFGGGFCAVN